MINMGTEPAGSTRDALTAEVNAEVARLGRVIRDAGIHERLSAITSRM